MRVRMAFGLKVERVAMEGMLLYRPNTESIGLNANSTREPFVCDYELLSSNR
jgi:hypothetical protein